MASVPDAALMVIDIQNDFCTGGSLEVPGSERVVRSINRYIDEATRLGLPVYASRDWHPAVTNHFAAYGGAWPVHCVQGTAGARFHSDLRLPAATTVITAGDERDADGYSAFEGHTPDGTSLMADLRKRGISHLYVGGLATDYCVRHSVLDALSEGLTVTVLQDAIAGVDVRPGDSDRAIAEMRGKGARFTEGALAA